MDPYGMQPDYGQQGYVDPNYGVMPFAGQPLDPYAQTYMPGMPMAPPLAPPKPPPLTKETDEGIHCRACDCVMADTDAEVHGAALEMGDCKLACCYCFKHDGLKGRVPKTFKTELAARQHRKAAHAWCDKCKVFVRDGQEHNTIKHPPPVAPCPLCPKGFKAIASMESHRQLVHFKCPECKQWFKDRKVAEGHHCEYKEQEPAPLPPKPAEIPAQEAPQGAPEGPSAADAAAGAHAATNGTVAAVEAPAGAPHGAGTAPEAASVGAMAAAERGPRKRARVEVIGEVYCVGCGLAYEEMDLLVTHMMEHEECRGRVPALVAALLQ